MIPRSSRYGSRWLFEHGTPAAHRRHRSHGEKPCRPCRDAWLAYKRAYDRGEWEPDTVIDEVAVRRAIQGEDIPLTRLERAEAARLIVAAGGGPGRIARILRTNGIRARQLYALATGDAA